MNTKTQDVIKKYNLEGCVSIVAVSGGVDSVVLLDLLAHKLGAKNIIVAHVNHGLRAESKAEAVFVRNLAVKYDLRYEEKSLKLLKRDEASARTERYKWFQTLAKKNGAKYIITAHHLDDQLETIILRLARGVGPLDVWGMKELSGEILRPLLVVSKKDISAYARSHKLKFMTDKSNTDIRYARNRVRHNVLPEIQKINPSLPETVAGEIRLGQEAASFFEAHLAKLERKYLKNGKIELRQINKLHPFEGKELIRRQLMKQRGGANVYQKNVEAVYDLLHRSGAKETHLGKITIKKSYKYLSFDEKVLQNSKSVPLAINRQVVFNGFKINLRQGQGRPNKNNILLPLTFSDNLRVRTWRTGDKIEAKFGTKKVQDVFVDAKIDASERKRWPIVTYKKEIVWVPRLIASKRAEKSGKKLIIEVK